MNALPLSDLKPFLSLSFAEKKQQLLALPVIKVALKPFLPFLKTRSSDEEGYLAILAALGQLSIIAQKNFFPEKTLADRFFESLRKIEKAYRSIGGILGYHHTFIRLLKKDADQDLANFSPPETISCENLPNAALRNALVHLDRYIEIYPIGGEGARLGLKDPKTGKPLPVALLSFNEKTLLEGLFRDLLAKEFLFYKLFNREISIPTFLMTSEVLDNDAIIKQFLKEHEFFQKDAASIHSAAQIAVPVITEDGFWCISDAYELILRPGGHGTLWSLLYETGALSKYLQEGMRFGIIRQINNPILGEDKAAYNLLASGLLEEKTFGFLACEHKKDAAEGVLALAEGKGSYWISNVEYISSTSLKDKENFPANVNLLFLDLKKLEPLLKNDPMPGLLINLKGKITTLNEQGTLVEKTAGRLESTMQNLSDFLKSNSPASVPTTILLAPRKKTLSVTKKKYEGKDLLETPEGAFNDLMDLRSELLKEHCSFQIVDEENVRNSLVIHIDPVLGPFWSIISQKIRRGRIKNGSELKLEIAELDMENLDLDGSLHIIATDPVGTGPSRFNPHGGKCCLKNVSFHNGGHIKKRPPNETLNREIRKEIFEIRLVGNAEFYAEDIHFQGAGNIVVPSGMRATAKKDALGVRIHYQELDSPPWTWHYAFDIHDEIKICRTDANYPS